RALAVERRDARAGDPPRRHAVERAWRHLAPEEAALDEPLGGLGRAGHALVVVALVVGHEAPRAAHAPTLPPRHLGVVVLQRPPAVVERVLVAARAHGCQPWFCRILRITLRVDALR